MRVAVDLDGVLADLDGAHRAIIGRGARRLGTARESATSMRVRLQWTAPARRARRAARWLCCARAGLGLAAAVPCIGGGGASAIATAATAAGRCGVVPLEGDLGRAARPVTPNVGACPPGRGGRTFGAGGGGCGAAGRARRRREPRRRGESDGQARGRGAERVVDGLRLARAATTCRRRAWDRQRVSPVVPPAGARARRHRRSRRCAGRRVGGHGPRLRGQSVSPPPPVPSDRAPTDPASRRGHRSPRSPAAQSYASFAS